jgi:hypothetical protein
MKSRGINKSRRSKELTGAIRCKHGGRRRQVERGVSLNQLRISGDCDQTTMWQPRLTMSPTTTMR